MTKNTYKVGDIIKTNIPRPTTKSKNGKIFKVTIKIPVTGKIKEIKTNGPKVYVITEGKIGDFTTRTIK